MILEQGTGTVAELAGQVHIDSHSQAALRIDIVMKWVELDHIGTGPHLGQAAAELGIDTVALLEPQQKTGTGLELQLDQPW